MLRAALQPCVLSTIRYGSRRSFFGIGEILGVIANPAETIRQLKESKDLLSQAKEEMALSNEAKKIPRKITFAKLPGFHGREEETKLLRNVLSSSTPTMNVIFGATSVGKTALLRQVLATDDFYVIKFDLRISGFADLRSLYLALCEQFEVFFKDMKNEQMDKNSLTFKHLSLDVDKKNEAGEFLRQIGVADIASLMESLQSCLLSYWEYEPGKDEDEKKAVARDESKVTTEPKLRLIDPTIERDEDDEAGAISNSLKQEAKEMDKDVPVFQKRPLVFLIDEAHKLPALINDRLVLKVLLDTLLDRLMNVIFCTSDSFFQHFLRQMNVGHHVQLMTIGDCSRSDTKAYFEDELLPKVPSHLQRKIDFEEIYHAFGGKLSHINDYIQAWINAEGDLTPYTCATFIQNYALLQFHLTQENFHTFSPLTTAVAPNSKETDEVQFSEEQLLHVMRRLVKSPHSVPYFELCREIGTTQVDAMIKTRILDLRWMKTVSPENDWLEREWSKDGVERPIILPMTRILQRAMEIVLKSYPDGAKTEKSPIGEDADKLYLRMPESIWKERPFVKT